MSSTGPATRAVCRILNQNSCGSGSVCGKWKDGSLVMTNGHVAGTDPDRDIVVEAELLGNKRFTGNIVEVMYNRNEIGADWALLYVPGLTQVQPVYLTKGLPAKNESMYTKGYPKCVKHAGTDIAQFQTINNGVLLWLPNAIGGQSGSGVWGDSDHLMKALLTWSIRQGNRWYGGGQLTNTIYDQMRGRIVKGFPRPKDWEFIELPGGDVNYDADGLSDPTVKDCYWTSRAVSEMWPIWHEDLKPTDPPVDTPSDRQWKSRYVESLRKYRDQMDAEIRSIEQTQSGAIDPSSISEETFGL